MTSFLKYKTGNKELFNGGLTVRNPGASHRAAARQIKGHDLRHPGAAIQLV